MSYPIGITQATQAQLHQKPHLKWRKVGSRISITNTFATFRLREKTNVINLSCSPAQGKPPEAASRHGRRAMTRPLPLNQAV